MVVRAPVCPGVPSPVNRNDWQGLSPGWAVDLPLASGVFVQGISRIISDLVDAESAAIALGGWNGIRNPAGCSRQNRMRGSPGFWFIKFSVSDIRLF
jgi:hypothetical protein